MTMTYARDSESTIHQCEYLLHARNIVFLRDDRRKLLSLNVHKSSGLDSIPALVLKGCAPELYPVLKQLFAFSYHNRVFNIGMTCMDAWIKRCLPTDGQRLVHQQIGGARAIMRFLCANETTALRRDFLKEQSCWARVSPEWSSCINELQDAVRDISDRAQLFTYFDRNGELCCARDDFMACVTQVGRLCSATAGNLLRRLAWVLAQDVAACNQPHAFCKASPAAVSAPILTALSTIFLYPPRL